jgi:opacity protein-like surface antigen
MKHSLVAGLLAALPLAALAQESSRPPVEIMPFGGFRVGGEFEDADTERDVDADDSASYGVVLRLRPSLENEWDLLYSRQQTDTEASTDGTVPSVDMTVEYLHIGGTYFPGDYDYAPYVLGGLGVTRLSPKGTGLEDETAFSISLGAGFRFPVAEHFALRLEGRAYATFLDTDTAIFCRSDGGGACAIRASGSTFLQFEAVLGFAFWF